MSHIKANCTVRSRLFTLCTLSRTFVTIKSFFKNNSVNSDLKTGAVGRISCIPFRVSHAVVNREVRFQPFNAKFEQKLCEVKDRIVQSIRISCLNLNEQRKLSQNHPDEESRERSPGKGQERLQKEVSAFLFAPFGIPLFKEISRDSYRSSLSQTLD